MSHPFTEGGACMEIAMSKDTKILIPDIPGEWTERTRCGHALQVE